MTPSITYRLILALTTLIHAVSAGADIELSQTPLAKAASQPVAPNLLYILDDSRSMAFQYTPDYVSTDYAGSGSEPDGVNYPLFYTTAGSNRGGISCRGSADGSLDTPETCMAGDPPYMAAQFNSQYYDPRIRYTPGTKADKSAYPSMNAANTSNWTKVPLDGYNVQLINQRWVKTTSTSVIDGTTYYTENLVSNIPDRLWCKTNSDNTLGSNCVLNSSYTYPNSTFGDGRSGGTTGTVKYVNTFPYYYNIKPLYCTDEGATSCSRTKGGSYLTEVPFRWCTSSGFTDANCQARRKAPYTIPSFIQPEVGSYSVGSLKITSGSKNRTLSITVSTRTDTYTLLSGFNSGSNNISTAEMAKKVRNAINSTNYTASCADSNCSDSVITLTAVNPDAAYDGTLAIGGNLNATILVHPTGGSSAFAFMTRVNITPGNAPFKVDGVVPTGRTDCSASGCTYEQEMENYANWFAYYRTRLQAMKSSTTRAFKDVDTKFRVGFATIKRLESSNYDVPISGFDSSQRSTWYSTLINTNIASNGGTPLKTSLNFAGRLFAGKTSFPDPMQYSCQQNFALLTTDGYWGDNPTLTPLSGSGSIGNQDGSTTARPYYEPNNTSNTLADIAMYYYNTDLRSPSLDNCTGSALGQDVCEDNVPVSNDDPNKKQHMVTFGLGLGVDGFLKYRSDYRTATSGDFYSVKTNGGLDWPAPSTSAEAKVDDLWHAAVNGRGTYFSARNPESLIAGIQSTLGSITASFGIGASAATSTSEPVEGDNFAYVATYTTTKWIGNLEARLINTSDGSVGKQAQWCAEDIPADADRGTTACTGTMSSKVSATSDSRLIYFNKANALTEFNTSNLTGLTSYFSPSQLNQYGSWSATYKTQAELDNNSSLINYLRGQTGYDTRESNTYRLYRQRETTLGDFVDSAPKYVRKASATYSDPGYANFSSKTVARGGVSDRTPAIYIGGNDGMLHAFNATNGQEMWAFIPTPALSEMWRLADDTYSNSHRFYVDGTVTVGDVCTSNCDSDSRATWKTVLVAALGAGVKQTSSGKPNSGYFALDVTDPANPSLLWELSSSHSTLGTSLGYSLGKPWLGKVEDASGNPTWAVLLSSGINPEDENGQLLVLNAYTGSLIRSINLPDAVGFSRFSPQFTSPGVDQTVLKVYGGDLQGNVWKINPNQSSTVTKIFSGANAFTTAPELTVCNDKTVVYIGSGKLLETGDLTSDEQQSIFGFVDNGTPITDPKTELQALSINGTKISGSSTTGSQVGWYLDLPGNPDNGGSERVALVDPRLDANLLTFVTNTPKNGICYASGQSEMYQFSLSACSVGTHFPTVGDGVITQLGNFLTVGLTFIKLPDGSIKAIATGSDGSISTKSSGTTTSPSFSNKRVNWRELIRE